MLQRSLVRSAAPRFEDRPVAFVQASHSGFGVTLESALGRRGLRVEIVDVSKTAELGATWELALAVAFAADACLSAQGLGALGMVRQSQPHLPLFCLVNTSAHDHARIRRLALAGADRVFVINGADEPDEIARAIVRATGHLLPSALVRELVSGVPVDVRPLVSWSLRRAWHRLLAEEMAEFFDENVTTVRRRLHRSGAPSVRTIVRLCRAAHVCAELDLTRHTEAVIAARLDFGGENSLRMLIRRALGGSVSSVRGVALSRLGEKWRGVFTGKADS